MNASSCEHSAIFFGADAPWVYALAESFAARDRSVMAIASYDWRNFRRLRPRWPGRQQPSTLQREFWVYPPGYAGTFASAFAPVLRRRLSRSTKRLGSARWVIVSYPWFALAARAVLSERLIYYNFDDYALYQPSRSAAILQQESELVNRASLTLCASQYQVETLRARFPDRANRIQHLPNAVVSTLLNPEPARSASTRVVGYLGNLADRVDWRMVSAVAQLLPDVEFHFVGSLDCDESETNSRWVSERTAAFAQANVHHLGPVAQDDVGPAYWNFTVNWMPYAIDHPFNVACCPTKIMDGLASGRPFLSTDVPECRLYREWISIFASPAEAAAAIQRLLIAAPTDAAQEFSQRQVEFVRQNHTWAKRAAMLEDLLSSNVQAQPESIAIGR